MERRAADFMCADIFAYTKGTYIKAKGMGSIMKKYDVAIVGAGLRAFLQQLKCSEKAAKKAL